MSDTEFRQGKKRFYDNTKFPRGFAKSGNFTIAEEEILTVYGDTMLGLETGELTPQSAEEKHFVKVIENPENAKSKLERVWLKYVQLARGRKRFHTLNGRNKPEASDDYAEDNSLVEED
ncbi:DUF413 domain-containing protein [Vibrio taketomensis]|uniref:DUF413 domain-containing protein n=1 Tax=Vibrio taketomensis TaxID=2572923 RepID=UPI0013898B44|nr:DUF413 domain-containing protein [Vibrio taketomensis]